MANSEATIFLSDSRICTQDKSFRSYQTLSTPFFNVLSFTDETLAPKAQHTHDISSGSRIVLIPLVGDLECNSIRISPGQATILDTAVDVSNPHNEELINYLRIYLNSSLPNKTSNFDIDTNRDELVPIFPGIHIGKYAGRRDDVYKRPGSGNVFVFILEGAFEVQNRLLHPRDALALTNVEEVEFEALSNEAILLFLNA